mmetsp:Transcript_14699/g.24905  ORF Transcript_14699/g.24905 Transcript_14699/m.24905 type:complete len:159 (-) Transcript_14699:105-581(-)|eukprot:CAMPEP_0116542294 /NCGR_PEP_ID=MMETSP0397-20121206/939_1 /TAXON_ID=216820 /ORGANISM="Cyclophora tenuis, Strain ECT3854" /LENGTH=158 /DNA_ID=CAMNT_0004066293 /DNA_START=30 /DNA_END=506 /DNA_ORIENTATION=-
MDAYTNERDSKSISEADDKSVRLVSDDDMKGSKGRMSTDEKKLKRIMANRRSARESRERRKKLLMNLETSVDILSKENANLVRENNELRQQLASLLPQAQTSLSMQGLSMPQHLQSMQAGFGGSIGGTSHMPTQQLLQLQKEQLLEAALRRRSTAQFF